MSIHRGVLKPCIEPGLASKLGLYSQFLPRHRDSRDALGSNEDFGLTRIKLVAL